MTASGDEPRIRPGPSAMSAPPKARISLPPLLPGGLPLRPDAGVPEEEVPETGDPEAAASRKKRKEHKKRKREEEDREVIAVAQRTARFVVEAARDARKEAAKIFNSEVAGAVAYHVALTVWNAADSAASENSVGCWMADHAEEVAAQLAASLKRAGQRPGFGHGGGSAPASE